VGARSTVAPGPPGGYRESSSRMRRVGAVGVTSGHSARPCAQRPESRSSGVHRGCAARFVCGWSKAWEAVGVARPRVAPPEVDEGAPTACGLKAVGVAAVSCLPGGGAVCAPTVLPSIISSLCTATNAIAVRRIQVVIICHSPSHSHVLLRHRCDILQLAFPSLSAESPPQGSTRSSDPASAQSFLPPRFGSCPLHH
jgi:hypothetical protein